MEIEIYDSEPEARVVINPRSGSIVISGDVEIGAFYDFTADWKIKIAGGYQAFVLGDTKDFFTSNFEARHSLSQNLDLRLEYNRFDENYEAILAVNFYF